MDAVKYLDEKQRMCESIDGDYDSSCNGCCFFIQNSGVDCEPGSWSNEDMVRMVKKWSNEHPVKTRQSEFLKMFPNADLDSDGCIDLCPRQIYSQFECLDKRCGKCQNEYWSQEIKAGIK